MWQVSGEPLAVCERSSSRVSIFSPHLSTLHSPHILCEHATTTALAQSVLSDHQMCRLKCQLLLGFAHTSDVFFRYCITIARPHQVESNSVQRLDNVGSTAVCAGTGSSAVSISLPPACERTLLGTLSIPCWTTLHLLDLSSLGLHLSKPLKTSEDLSDNSASCGGLAQSQSCFR